MSTQPFATFVGDIVVPSSLHNGDDLTFGANVKNTGVTVYIGIQIYYNDAPSIYGNVAAGNTVPLSWTWKKVSGLPYHNWSMYAMHYDTDTGKWVVDMTKIFSVDLITIATVYTCPTCGAVFTTQALLDAHIASAHSGDDGDDDGTDDGTNPAEPSFFTKYWKWIVGGGAALVGIIAIGLAAKKR